MKFKTIVFGLVLLLTLSFGCKKKKESPELYDVENRILRVKATSGGTPYTLTISGTNLNFSANKIAVEQNTGEEFNYGYTPALGSQIHVTVKSTKPISCFVNYKGKYTWQVQLKSIGGGMYFGELTYLVAE